jgi:hypothetical protein
MGYASDGAPGTVPIYIDSFVTGYGYSATNPTIVDAAITPAAKNEWLVGLAEIQPYGGTPAYGTTVTGTKTLPIVTYTPDQTTAVMYDSNGTVAQSLMSEVFTGPGNNFWVALVAIADTLPVKSGFFDFF